jgi:molybdopterin synthase catalytic subunit
MKIQVLYFAIFKERIKLDGEQLDIPDGSTVNAALERLGEKHECIANLAGRFQTAVNREMVPTATELHEGDELALIPPVAGGSDVADRPARHVIVSDEALSLDRCIRAVTTRDMGGITTFTGIVRRRSRGVDVERLEYSAYEQMAVEVMEKLCAEIEAEIAGCLVAVEHRVGTLDIGDAAVVIAAGAPHRAEAFTACRAMIDRLKEHVPIWKKEISPDGAEWVGLGP